MKDFSNKQKNKYIGSIIDISLEDISNDLTNRMKFNFSYLDTSQEFADDFNDWTDQQRIKLFTKLKEYSRKSILQWKQQFIGSGKKRHSVCVIYGNFPKHSKFKHPKHIPHQACWGRFRLESSVRLAGFIVPDDKHDMIHCKTGLRFDKNTFYVVFLDSQHKFYPCEPK